MYVYVSDAQSERENFQRKESVSSYVAIIINSELIVDLRSCETCITNFVLT